jgi:Rod binding domain-containing protein
VIVAVNSFFPPAKPQAPAMKAAQDFEALLLANLLRGMQQAWSAVPGESSDAASDNLRDMATQSLASALAASGGLGIARLIASKLPTSQAAGNSLNPDR